MNINSRLIFFFFSADSIISTWRKNAIKWLSKVRLSFANASYGLLSKEKDGWMYEWMDRWIQLTLRLQFTRHIRETRKTVMLHLFSFFHLNPVCAQCFLTSLRQKPWPRTLRRWLFRPAYGQPRAEGRKLTKSAKITMTSSAKTKRELRLEILSKSTLIKSSFSRICFVLT